MFVEGYIDKDYFDMLIQWGHEPDWVCTTVEEANEKGYDVEVSFNKLIARFWLDMDMEDFFKLEDMVRDKPDLLSFMAVSPNKTIREFAEQKLRTNE